MKRKRTNEESDKPSTTSKKSKPNNLQKNVPDSSENYAVSSVQKLDDLIRQMMENISSYDSLAQALESMRKFRMDHNLQKVTQNLPPLFSQEKVTEENQEEKATDENKEIDRKLSLLPYLEGLNFAFSPISNESSISAQFFSVNFFNRLMQECFSIDNQTWVEVILSKVSSMFPSNPVILYWEARYYLDLQSEQHQKALHLFNTCLQLLKIDNSSTFLYDLHAYLGECHYRNEAYEKAKKYFSVASFNGSSLAHLRLGILQSKPTFAQSQEKELILEHFKQAIRLAGQTPEEILIKIEAYLLLGTNIFFDKKAYEAKSEILDGINIAKNLLATNLSLPKKKKASMLQAKLYLSLAEIQEVEEQWDKALQSCSASFKVFESIQKNESIQDASFNENLYAIQGRCYKQLSLRETHSNQKSFLMDRAIRMFLKGLSFCTTSSLNYCPFLISLIECYNSKRDPASIEQLLLTSIEDVKNDPKLKARIQILLGQHYFSTVKEFDQAIIYLNSASTYDPCAWTLLTKIYSAQDNAKKMGEIFALHFGNTLCSHASCIREIQFNLAEFFQKHSLYEQATVCYTNLITASSSQENFLEKNKNLDFIYYQRTECFYMSKKYMNALKDCPNFLNSSPLKRGSISSQQQRILEIQIICSYKLKNYNATEILIEEYRKFITQPSEMMIYYITANRARLGLVDNSYSRFEEMEKNTIDPIIRSKIQFKLGRHFLKENKINQALNFFEHAMRQGNHAYLLKIHFNIALCWEKKNNEIFFKKKLLYKAIIKETPTKAGDFCRRGYAFLLLNRITEANNDFKRCEQKDERRKYTLSLLKLRTAYKILEQPSTTPAPSSTSTSTSTSTSSPVVASHTNG